MGVLGSDLLAGMIVGELMMATLATKRHFQTRRCPDRIMRPMLEYLGNVHPADVDGTIIALPHVGELLLARGEARKALIGACKRCPRAETCPMGKLS